MSDKQNNGASSPPQSQGSQVTQNIAKKYTILSDIKVLQDRLQDMYTNRADLVNITGDGLAAAHYNESREIMWVYWKSVGAVAGFHGALAGIAIGLFVAVFAGISIEIGLGLMGVILLLVSAIAILAPFGYLLYAEILTEESRMWAIGRNTEAFFGRMHKAMQSVVSVVWAATAASFIAAVFVMGLISDSMVAMSTGYARMFGVYMPEHLEVAVFDRGSVYGVSWLLILLAGVFMTRTIVIEKVKNETKKRSDANRKIQNAYKHLDAVQEVREIFN